MSFTIFLNEKKVLLGYKKQKVQKVKKLTVFQKSLPMVLTKKMAIVPTYFLGNIGEENVFDDILERENACVGYENKKFKQSKNRHFSKGVYPWFLSKIAIFPTFFFRQYRPGKCLL